jgi:transforming growth factor-beta-induced protein
MKLHSAKILEGRALSIRVSGGKVIVGGAAVIAPNMTASNGVIHVINKVQIP